MLEKTNNMTILVIKCSRSQGVEQPTAARPHCWEYWLLSISGHFNKLFYSV